MTGREELVEQMVPLALELVGTVRDYGPEDVATVLGKVPGRPADFGPLDALAVVLAGMVDPDARPAQLLAWTQGGPVQSRDTARPPGHLTVAAVSERAPRRGVETRAEVARLTVLGLTSGEIADRLGITKRSVHRHRQALAEAA